MTQNACNCKTCKPFIKEGETANKWDETGEFHICGKCGKSYSPYQSLDAEYKLNKMTDKLYNGRDKSDGVGGREVNHGTQQSMTKAEMIYPKIGIEPKQFTDTHQERCYPLTVVSDLMDEWADQEVAKEREKAKKLIGALNEYIVLLGEELDEVMGFVNAHQWKSTRFEQGKILREKIKQSLIEYGQPNSL
jgi:hypothetical protein